MKKKPYKAKNESYKAKRKYYKAFNPDMTCRGFKYQVGKTYKEEYAKLGIAGFHFCENPLDCLHYYSPIDDSGNIVKINRVTPLGIIYDKHNVFGVWDTKKCTTKIKIEESVDLDTIIKESREYLLNSPTTEFLNNYYYNWNSPQKLGVQVYEICGLNITNNSQSITDPQPNTLHIILNNTSIKSNVLIEYYSDVYLENYARRNNLIYNNVTESIINSIGDICNIICIGNDNLIYGKSNSTNILIKGLRNTIDIRNTHNKIKLLSNSDSSLTNVWGRLNKIYNESNNIDIRMHEAYNTLISNGDNCNILVNISCNLIECNGKNCNIIVNGEYNYIKASIGTHITFTNSFTSFKKSIIIDGNNYKENLWYGVEQSCGKSIINGVNKPTKVEEKIAQLLEDKSN